MTVGDHLPRARESAQFTYDRRRARRAAETLAEITPNRWDDKTRQIVATLATISSPSRIDDALEAFDGEPADALVEITPRLFPVGWDRIPQEGTESLEEAMGAELERMRLWSAEPLDDVPAPLSVPTMGPLAPKSATLRGLEPDVYPPCGEQQHPRPDPYPQPRPRPDPDPRPRPEPHPRPQPQRALTGDRAIEALIRAMRECQHCEMFVGSQAAPCPEHAPMAARVHDNGDYRA